MFSSDEIELLKIGANAILQPFQSAMDKILGPSSDTIGKMLKSRKNPGQTGDFGFSMDQERPYLIALPPQPFIAARVEQRLVGYDFCIAWDTNRYSVSPSFVGRSVQAMELDGVLDVYLNGAIIASHRLRDLRDTRHKRFILPEHESEFRQHSTSRHVLQRQFLRLGEIAQAFTDELIKAHGGAAGYRISEILKLADQAGVPRVLEALRHAARYGAFSHTVPRSKPASLRRLRLNCPS